MTPDCANIARSADGESDTAAVGHLLQSSFWADVKSAFGWQSLRLKLPYGEKECTLQILHRRLGAGLALAYIPYPDLPEEPPAPAEALCSLAKAMAPQLPRRVRFIRFDLPWYREGAGNLPVPLAGSNRLRKAPVDIQPPSTVLINLEPSEEQLLEAMKSKTRYNIRLARRKGVEVLSCTDNIEENLKIWYTLYQETALRDKITIHSFAYYQRLFQLSRLQGGPQIKLLLARIEDEYVAGIILAFYGKEATYLYGASSHKKRNLMPNHALQWEAICQARRAGCSSYDFFGIPEHIDPQHPMSGLYRFKTGFGGTIINRYGCYDYILSRPYYAAYRIAEGLRRFYYKKWRKRR